jgi:tetratricopeptide (TPR) repeat protein
MRLEGGHALAATTLADIFRGEMRFSEAEAILRSAQERDPADPTTTALLARVLMDQGRLDEAEPVVRAALDLAPDNVVALVSAGHLALARGHTPQALDLVLWALQLAPTDPAALELFCIIKARRYPVFAVWLRWCQFVVTRGPTGRVVATYAPTVVLVILLQLLRRASGFGLTSAILISIAVSLTLWSAPFYLKYLISRESRTVTVRPTY